VRGASARLQRMVCEANRAGSFEKASRLLSTLARLEVSPKRVQLITERVGAALAAEREKATEAFFEGRAPAPSAAPTLLVVSADGGRVQTREEDRSKKWKENKVGVVYDAEPRPEEPGKAYEGPPPLTRSTSATMRSWEEFGDAFSALADRRGYRDARDRIFLSDGAFALRSLRERCFPDAVFVLDWAHAVEHLHACAVARFGEGPQAERWYEAQKARLWDGRADLVSSHLRRAAADLGPPPQGAAEGDPRRILANNVQYFRDNAAGMNYREFRRRGWPIGSGVIEATIKQFGKRVKGTEKHWSLTGVEETLQVMACLIGEDAAWENFWRHCPLAA